MVGNQEDRLFRYRAKRLRFMINGDRFFPGINYALNTEKIRSFDTLLNDLNASLMDHIKLCKGVRFILSPQGEIVTSLADFKDGNTYYCSSTDTYIQTDYNANHGKLNWLIRNSACISSCMNNKSERAPQESTDLTKATATTSYTDQDSSHSPSSGKLASQYSSNSTSSSSGNRSNGNHNGRARNHTKENGHGQTTHESTQSTKQAPKLRPSQPSPAKNPRQLKLSINSADGKQSKTTTNDKDLSQRKSNTPTRNHISRNVGSKAIQQDHSDKQITSGTVRNNLVVNNQSGTKLNPASSGKPETAKSNNSVNNNSQNGAEAKTDFGIEVKEKYDIGEAIGDGHFSVVYSCMNKSSKQFCALKLIDKYKCRGRDDMIYNEVKILKQLNHPNVVKLIEEFDYTEQLYLILELVRDGDLFDAISSVTTFSENHVSTMMFNLSSALTYLHKQGIVHRDIKPENLLISIHEDGSHSLKLADFGLAVDISDDRTLFSVCGTAFYVSPEMLNETGYSYKVDVWSTGVICFILLCGYPPFTSTENESDQDELFDAILAGDFQFAPPYWSKISQHAKNLIKYMLTVDVEKRYSAEQVFKHPWTMGTSNNFDGIDPFNISRRVALSQSQ